MDDKIPEGLEDLLKDIVSGNDEEESRPDPSGILGVKKGKIDINKVLNKKPPINPESLKTETDEKEKDNLETDKEFKTDVLKGLNQVLASLNVIKSILQTQNKNDKKEENTRRIESQRGKQKSREKELEKDRSDRNTAINLPEIKPVGGFFDKVIGYFKNILIGSVVVSAVKWMQDPKNKESIEKFKNFMVDNAPAILGGILAIVSLPIASTLLGLTTTIISGLVTLGGALVGLTALIPGFGWVLLGAGIGAAAVFGIRKISEAVYGGDIHGVSEGFDRVDKDLRKRRREIMDMEDGPEKTAAREEYDTIQENLKNAKEKILPQMRATKSMEGQLEYKTERLKYFESIIEDESNATGISRDRDIAMAGWKAPAIAKEIEDLKINIPQSKRKQEKYIEEYFPNGVPKGNIQKIEEFVEDSRKLGESLNKSLENLKAGAASLTQNSETSGSGTSGSSSRSVGGYEVVPASHSETGSGFGIKSSDGNFVLDANGRPVVFSKEGATAFAQILQDSGGMVKGSDIASAQRSQAKNALEGGVPGSKHLTGNAMDIHGDSQIWLKAYGGKYDWNLAPYKGSHGGHFVFGDGGSSAPPPPTTSSAQLLPVKPTTPTIYSPTRRDGIGGILPIPTGGGGDGGGGSSSGANQAKVPIFSSDDPNNMSIMVIKGIYNVVG
jgi:uncharacterized protein YcbK (DUF882 family)